MEEIIKLDEELLLLLNGSSSPFFDSCMMVYTSKLIWIPLAVVFLYVLIKNNNIKDFIFILCVVALIVLIADQISSSLCKPLFERWRPTHDPDIMYLVDVVNHYRAGSYGFLSSHSANSYAIAVFASLLIRHKGLSLSLLLWATLNAYSRVYLGVHYPGDILVGGILGVLVGWSMYRFYCYIQRKMGNSAKDWISDHFTQSGYKVADVHLLLLAIYATFTIIPMIAFFTLLSY